MWDGKWNLWLLLFVEIGNVSGKEEEVDGERVLSVDVVIRCGLLFIVGKNWLVWYLMSLIVLMEVIKMSCGGFLYICD